MKVTLIVTRADLLHKNDIDKGLNIMNKWYKVKVIYPWFYRMKNLLDNYFDDIRTTITNREKDININLININRKTSKSITFTLSCPSLVSQKGENYSILDDKNKDNIE